MKIALVSQEYPPVKGHGGIGTQTYMRAHGLANLGHEVFVISHSEDSESHTFMDNAVHVFRIPGIDHRLTIYSDAVRWLSYSTEVAIAVHKIHSETPLDIVVFPEWGGEGYIHLLNQTEWNHIPTVVHIHGPLVMFTHTMNWPDINSEFYKVGSLMERTSLHLANAVSASNACSLDWCVRHYGMNASEIPILYTGIDTSLFYPRDVIKEERPTIIFVGSIRRNKGVDLLVKASCILTKDYPDLQLRILGKGDPSLINELVNITIEAGVPNLLQLPGFIRREELPFQLSRADFFAGPSFYEGGPGNVYLEAMACGIPIIACSGSGIDGIVTTMENGILIPPKNLQALIDALRTLLENPDLCNTLGRNAKEYVLREADSKICIKRLEAFYKSVGDKTNSKIKAIQNASS